MFEMRKTSEYSLNIYTPCCDNITKINVLIKTQAVVKKSESFPAYFYINCVVFNREISIIKNKYQK